MKSSCTAHCKHVCTSHALAWTAGVLMMCSNTRDSPGMQPLLQRLPTAAGMLCTQQPAADKQHWGYSNQQFWPSPCGSRTLSLPLPCCCPFVLLFAGLCFAFQVTIYVLQFIHRVCMSVDAVITPAVGRAVFDLSLLLVDSMLPFCFDVLQGCVIVFVLHFHVFIIDVNE